MFKRRDLLVCGLAGTAAGIVGPQVRSADAQLSNAEPFDPGSIAAQARMLAKKPFRPPDSDLPDVFKTLSYEQYVSIRAKPGTAIWLNEATGFLLEPLHRGMAFATPMTLNLVENGTVRRLAYDSRAFDFGALQVPPSSKDLGFSGFRVLRPRDEGEALEVALFQGYSFFRAEARGQSLGAVARALAIRTADVDGEELPLLRAAWIEKPTLASNALVIHALLDSPSLTGAFRFTLRPGEATLIDTECTLFTRVEVANFGLGAMQATALLGPLDRRRLDDIRPEVADVSGLQVLTSQDEWLWRPVSNRETLQISSFADQNPKGFGFIQRHRRFEQFQDDDQHWELRPSLWIEPIGEWGAGAVQLIEIPSDAETNDNIVAFWRPKSPLPAGAEQSFAYRQFWCWTPPSRPPLAIAALARGGRVGKRRRFLVEFSGDVLGDLQRTADMKPMLSASPGTITDMRGFLSREAKSFRVLFDLDPGGESFSEIRLVLESGGKPLSETWLYRWTP